MLRTQPLLPGAEAAGPFRVCGLCSAPRRGQPKDGRGQVVGLWVLVEVLFGFVGFGGFFPSMKHGPLNLNFCMGRSW